MSTTNSRLLGVREAAELLGVHENTLRNWVRRGQVEVSPYGFLGRTRFTPQEIERVKLALESYDPHANNKRTAQRKQRSLTELTVLLRPRDREHLEQCARAQKRALSTVARSAVRQYLDQRGYK